MVIIKNNQTPFLLEKNVEETNGHKWVEQNLQSHATVLNPDGIGGSVGCASGLRSGGCGFDHRQVWQHSFVEIDYEIFSTVILSLLLIREGQMSVSGKRMDTYWLNT